MSTPGPGGPQPPEQDPTQPSQPQNWGQSQPPAGQQPWGAPQQPAPGQQPDGQGFPAQQPPAGQGVPGQQPWGAPQQPGGAQAFGGQPAKPKRKLVPILISALGLVAVVLLALNFLGANAPEVGDCVRAEGFSDVETVSCDSDDADYSIIGEAEEMTGDEFDATPGEELCADFPEATNVFWYGSTDDGDGKVYCVTDV